MAEQRGFFGLDERYAALSKAGDPLERLPAVLDFEVFRPALDAALNRSDGSKGGRPPMDPVLMALLHRSGSALTAPFPRFVHPILMLRGMPRAVKRLMQRTATAASTF
jgi:hypothetical protein